MELEKERGISVTSSVLQFDYRGHAMNLLDTPGHQDFSEDTYRTLAAADSAVMLIDAAKGVEPQTKKLFQVCRMRAIPIFTFVNKLDRYGRAPLDLMDELEQVLGIRAYPMNWPIGMGPEFRGVYDRAARVVHVFSSEGTHGEAEVGERSVPLDSPDIAQVLAPAELAQLREDVELLDVGGDAFDREKSDQGQITPMFFGSGDDQLRRAPVPRRLPRPRARARAAQDRPAVRQPPTDAEVQRLRLQDPGEHGPGAPRPHRLRARVSGRYVKGMNAHHVAAGQGASGSPSPASSWPPSAPPSRRPGPATSSACSTPGSSGSATRWRTASRSRFEGVPRFSPEHFAVVRSKDPLRRKQMEKGLEQLSRGGHRPDLPAAADGHDATPSSAWSARCSSRCSSTASSTSTARRSPSTGCPSRTPAGWWARSFDPKAFDWEGNRQTVQDRDGLPLVLFRDDWALAARARRSTPSSSSSPRRPSCMGASRAPPPTRRSRVLNDAGGQEPAARAVRLRPSGPNPDRGRGQPVPGQVPFATVTLPQPDQVYLAPASCTGAVWALVVEFSVRRISRAPPIKQNAEVLW